MKKIFTLSFFMILSCSLQAFNLYNASSLDDLQDGATLNRVLRFGLADTEQATLISPRLAVTARHAGQGDIAVNKSISFYGQSCKIIRTIDRPDLKIGLGDLTLYVLDRDIILPEGEAFCPIATQTRSIGKEFGDGQGFLAHAISHSPHIKLAGQKHPSKNKSVLYGRTVVDKALFSPSQHEAPFADTIRVIMGADKDCDLMTPIKGDSGSPLYVPLKNGGYALWGALSCVDATDAHKFGCYTSLACNIAWLQRKETDLISRGLLPPTVTRIKTVNQDDWDLTKSDSLALPRNFDVALYLALNPDLEKAFQTSKKKDFDAKNHFLRSGRHEKRFFDLPQTFKPKHYALFNPDLDALTRDLPTPQKDRFLKLHYARHGQKENRLFAFPDHFCWATYVALNQDLAPSISPLTPGHAKAFAKGHFARHGHAEHRLHSLTPSFNWSAYLGENPDLDSEVIGLSFKDKKHFVQKHFALHGYHEHGRKHTLLDDFKAKTYLTLYKDLAAFTRNMSPAEQEHFLIFHYVRCGQKEGRLYRIPDTFDIRCYYGFNPDLQKSIKHLHTSERGAFLVKHFIDCGYREGRPYALPVDFDPACYLALHMDVRSASKSHADPITFARNHYRRRGILEGRPYKKPLPHDFSVEGYLAKNPDIAAFLASYSETERQRLAIQHYQTQGALLEGRSY